MTKDDIRKNYVLDTNVLLHDPICFRNFTGNNVIIPLTVLEELDNLKTREGLVGYQAREAVRELHNAIDRSGTNGICDGIHLGRGVMLYITLPDNENKHISQYTAHKNDNMILDSIQNIIKLSPDTKTILVSKDVCMRIKAEAAGVVSEDYKTDRVVVEDLFKGYVEISLSSKNINRIFLEGMNPPRGLKLYPNQFVYITAKDKDSQNVVVRFDGKNLIPLQFEGHSAWGLKPMNREQVIAFELLMDPAVQFVTITGGAGSGKTILATAVALEKVLEQKEYRKIIFVRPVIAAGNEIGYLPGSEEEKLRPWMGSFYDAIETLSNPRHHREQKPRKQYKNLQEDCFQTDLFIEDLRQRGLIEMKTFTYMRGRTLHDAIVIVDEAQEITPHLAKLMLTRAGTNSKFIFLGDPTDNQIDNIFVDSRSNGLVYVVEKMKEHTITGHVTLKHVERSRLAGIAEKSL